MSTKKLTELKLLFLTGPLDDVMDVGAPVMPKWQTKEAMHNMLEEYMNQLIDEGEFTTVMCAGRTHEMPDRDFDNDEENE